MLNRERSNLERDDSCAACGTHERVHPDDRCGLVPFCLECKDWARNLTEWDDIGALD